MALVVSLPLPLARRSSAIVYCIHFSSLRSFARSQFFPFICHSPSASRTSSVSASVQCQTFLAHHVVGVLVHLICLARTQNPSILFFNGWLFVSLFCSPCSAHCHYCLIPSCRACGCCYCSRDEVFFASRFAFYSA